MNDDIDELLQHEIERQLPRFERGADQQTLRAALHGLRGSISMAGYSDISLVLAQLGRRLLDGDANARREAAELLRATVSRLKRGLPAVHTSWPAPPPGLRASAVSPALKAEYLAGLRGHLGEIDAALGLGGGEKAALAQVYRGVHSMKSSASSVGDDAFAWYCHGLEGFIKPALDSERNAREVLPKLGQHRAICATWLLDPTAALEALRVLSEHPPSAAYVEAPSAANREAFPPQGVRKASPSTSRATTTSAELFERVSRGLSYVLANTDRVASITTRGNQVIVPSSALDALELALLQLVLNSLAHGLESPDERRQANKNQTGQITLTAEQQGEAIRFVVEDDGRGVDPAELRELLVARGVLDAARAASKTPDELLAFLFLPGLSTRTEADLLGGRGMGLDVAREAVQNVGGTLRLTRGTQAGLVATIEVPGPAGSTGEPSLSRARPEHGSEVRRLARLAGLFVDPEAELAREDAYLLVAETSSGLVGFVSARLAGDVVELSDLVTHPAWRRRGVAQRLVLELASHARESGVREIHLEVRESNLGAIALYDKLGFERIRRRERYYKNPVEDALCLMLAL